MFEKVRTGAKRAVGGKRPIAEMLLQEDAQGLTNRKSPVSFPHWTVFKCTKRTDA